MLPTLRNAPADTAHERLKQRSEGWLRQRLALSLVVHVLILMFGPGLHLEDVAIDRADPIALAPPNIEIPAAPEDIASPSAPSAAIIDLSAIVSLQMPTFEWHVEIEDLPPPPPPASFRLSRVSAWIPYTLAPRLLNRREVYAAFVDMARRMKGAGTAVVLFYVDQEGRVTDARIREPSRFEPFNQAVLKLGPLMRFAPAQSRDKRIPVWVSMPFTVGGD